MAIGLGRVFCESGLSLLERGWAELVLTGSEVEEEEESEVVGDALSDNGVRVWDIVAGVLVYLRGVLESFLGPGASFCSSNFSLPGSGVEGGGDSGAVDDASSEGGALSLGNCCGVFCWFGGRVRVFPGVWRVGLFVLFGFDGGVLGGDGFGWVGGSYW